MSLHQLAMQLVAESEAAAPEQVAAVVLSAEQLAAMDDCAGIVE
jgi:hypothetical protein